MWQQITPIVEQINSNIAMINKKQKPTNSFAQINVREFIAAKYMFFNVLFLYSKSIKYPHIKVIITGYKKHEWFQSKTSAYSLNENVPS